MSSRNTLLFEKKNDNGMKIAAVIGGIVVIGVLYLMYRRNESLTMTDCTSCQKCGENMIRPRGSSRYGCNSTKCRCINDIKPFESTNIKLDCKTCSACEKNMERPDKTISTTKHRGCNDKRCRCQSSD